MVGNFIKLIVKKVIIKMWMLFNELDLIVDVSYWKFIVNKFIDFF